MTDATLLVGRPELIGAPEDYVEWVQRQKNKPRSLSTEETATSSLVPIEPGIYQAPAAIPDEDRRVSSQELARLLSVATDLVVRSVLISIRDQGHVVAGSRGEYSKVTKTNRYLSQEKRYRLYQSSPTGVEPKRYTIFRLP